MGAALSVLLILIVLGLLRAASRVARAAEKR
jgi:hypothetical protein